MKIRPLHDRVVVEPLEEIKQSKGGIIIPDTAKEKPMEGKIVAVGPGKPQDNGGVRKPAVKEGDKVLFGKYSGTEIKIDGKDLLVIREEDIMAIV
jgi:chaperonin GroES